MVGWVMVGSGLLDTEIWLGWFERGLVCLPKPVLG